MPAVSKFTNDSGTRLLKALFYETTLADKSTCVYTLKNEDHKGFPSLYRLYMETLDPTEYRFATQYLADWEHWTALCLCTWFTPYVTRWREELQLKLASDSLLKIMDTAKDSASKDAFSANKYLLEKGWQPKGKVGRPSKEAIRAEANALFQSQKREKDDAERLGVLGQ